MAPRLATFLFLLTAAAATFPALPGGPPAQSGSGLRVLNGGSWKPVEKGVEVRALLLERLDPRYSFELKLVRLDPRWVAPRLIHSSRYQLKGADVKTLAEKSGALAAVNGSYFDENGRALGFLKTGGREINPAVSRSALLTGIFGVREGAPFIVHRDEFQPEGTEEAMQSGPLLLSRGRVLEPARGWGRASRRAVIGVDEEQRLIVGVTDVLLGGAYWGELQEIFSEKRWELKTIDLLNLDGGGSAQLYLKARGLESFVRGVAEIPVAIGFFARNGLP
ncbi:MAG TPA: phosphodiester glycosidase family protein [candidate division Zixibacteria bacterium]|nr:phosphodiester glycosidase family protein [candidate division Zixibacteria bacterium]